MTATVTSPAARLLARRRAYTRFALASPGLYLYLFSQHAPTATRRTAMHPAAASRHRPPATTVAWLAGAALVSAVIPAAAGLAFLISLAARRPLVAVAAQHWPWLTGRPAAQPPHRTLTGLTATWGIGLLAAAAVQGAGAITGGLTFTSPASFAARAAIALAVEASLAALTIARLHRRPVVVP